MNEDKTIKQKKYKNSKFFLGLKRIGAYISASFIDFKRSPLTIFFTVAYPVILILLFGAIFSTDNISSPTFTLYYQSGGDEGFYTSPSTHLNLTSDFINTIESIDRNDSTPIFNLIHIPHKDSSGTTIVPGEYLEEVNGYIAIIIPTNFTQQVIFNPPINLTVILDENSESAGIALEIINSIVYYLNNQMAGYNETKIGMDTTNIYLEEEIDYFEFLIPGIIGIAIMNNGIIGTINRYTYFDKKGFFRKLSSSPMKKSQVVIGEATWVLIQGFISILVILLIGYLAFKIRTGNYQWIITVLDWKMIPITIATVLNFTGLGMISARIVKNPSAATAVGNFLSFPMMFLSGAFFEVAHIPVLNIISKILPLTYIINAFRSSMIIPNISLAWINIGISFAFGIVIFVIGILVTKLSER
ncbi:MAG: ABC transporter permease [Candidatus Heimdallarchaeota archaeon]|nr:ABC transporter permease [Candidatus Heimdallarchaeota archaeon]